MSAAKTERRPECESPFVQRKEIRLRVKTFFRDCGDNEIVLVLNLLGCNRTSLCKLWANFGLRLGKVLVIWGKFIEDIWASYLQFWTSLGNSFGQIRAYSNRFGQFRTCHLGIFAPVCLGSLDTTPSMGHQACSSFFHVFFCNE